MKKIKNDFKLENMRFEVIDEIGRQYVKYNVNLHFSFQDDNRTLKIFVTKNNDEKEIDIQAEMDAILRFNNNLELYLFKIQVLKLKFVNSICCLRKKLKNKKENI